MEAVFLKLVNMSLTASWLVLAVLLVRLVFKKAPKWIYVVLWGLVALRLACPFSMESALSLIPSSEPLPQEIISGAAPVIDTGITPIDSAVNPVLSEAMAPAAGAAATPAQVWSSALAHIWLAGLVAMLLYSLVSYALLKRRVATATRLRDNIRQSEQVESPFVLGLFRPTIYLPYAMAAEDMVHVIAHEQAHIRRRDHWWKPFGFLLLSVYWFNPILWAAYILLCRDIEAACDEKVIREMEKDDRRAYSMALLNCSVHRRRIAACPLAFGEAGVKDRIKSVMNYQRPAFWVIVVSVLACAVVAVCFLTNPEKLSFDFDADPIDHIITQYSPADEAPGDEDIQRLDQTQADELKNRLLDLTGAKRVMRYNHAGTVASIDIVLASGADIYIQSQDDGTLQLQYDAKIFRIENEGFHEYVKALCSGARDTDGLAAQPMGGTEDTEGLVTWTYSPMMSASWHAFFHFSFDVNNQYIHIEASCDNGTLWNLQAEGQPSGKSMRFEAGEPVCWTPDMDGSLSDTAARATVSFAVYDGGEMLYTGALEITRTGTENGQSFYEARLAGTDLLTLRQEEGNLGAAVTLSDSAAIIAVSDLDHDGETEYVVVRTLAPGMLYELAVEEQDGTKIWTTEASPAHTGWNTIMLYSEGGQDYLVQYLPAMFQGVGNYTCTVFSLEGGRQTVKDAWSVDFVLEPEDPVSVAETPEMAQFAEEVNILLRKSLVLLSTEYSILVDRPAEASSLPQLYPVRFNPDEIQAAIDSAADAQQELSPNASQLPDAPLELVFSSGAGGWGTALTLNPDGSFTGSYSDADMGINAPEYPGGTYYVCTFEGRFTDIKQISDYAWSMKLASLTTENPEGETWIADGIRYIASAPYGLDGGEDFILYAPGAPADELPAECRDWWPEAYLWRNGELDQLTGWGLCNVSAGYGFFQ